MPAGTIVTSRTHKTKHPFVLTKGACEIVSEDGSRDIIAAPYLGITEAGTRRVLVVLEDCEWTTFHATDKTDPNEIAETITETSNDLLPHDFKPLCFDSREVLK
jgi:hypothetical protein